MHSAKLSKSERLQIEMINKRFGRWMVCCLATKGSHTSPKKWLCLCDCGTLKKVNGVTLRNGVSRSCGCLSREITSKLHTVHGMSGSPEFKIWCKLRSRCTNKKQKDYSYYGGRGIKVCERWRKFENFFDDMGPKPYGYEIDRIDNNLGYSPGNCRWATHKQNSRNTRRARYVSFKGKKLCISEWAEEIGVNENLIRHRLNIGYPAWMAITSQKYKRGVHKQPELVA